MTSEQWREREGRPKWVKVVLTVIAVPLEVLALLYWIVSILNRDGRTYLVATVITLVANVLLMIAWGGEDRASRYDDY